MTQKRVLLVDDEISSAEVLSLVLTTEGYAVTMASDGRQALARLDEAAPDLVITDFMMPMVNGAELVRTLRGIPAYAQLPIILMSGAPESALQPYGIRYQAFLRKPFNLDEFLGAIRSALG